MKWHLQDYNGMNAPVVLFALQFLCQNVTNYLVWCEFISEGLSANDRTLQSQCNFSDQVDTSTY